MTSASRRERRTFLWGVLGLVILGLGVFTPIAYFTGWGPYLFVIEMLLVVAWLIRHQRAARAARQHPDA